jgi:hypothetical protein
MPFGRQGLRAEKSSSEDDYATSEAGCKRVIGGQQLSKDDWHSYRATASVVHDFGELQAASAAAGRRRSVFFFWKRNHPVISKN